MKINKEGYKIIGLTGVVCFLLWALMYYLMSRHAEAGLLWFGSILLVLFLVLYRGIFPGAAACEDP